jgi:hypothetical protein
VVTLLPDRPDRWKEKAAGELIGNGLALFIAPVIPQKIQKT